MDGASESIRSAVYYPHTGVRTLDMLKTGLLLWDEVQFIAPDENFHPQAPRDVRYEDPLIVAQAMELLLKRHVPTDDEKERTHETVEMLINSDLGDRLAGEGTGNTYLIYPQKFSEKTWRLLEESRLAQVELEDPDCDYGTSNVLGLVMMSVLADTCAGSMLRTVTDQQAAYTTVRESFARNTITPEVAVSDEIPKLVDITLRIADLENIPLSDLVELRRREQREGAGSTLTSLRRSFAARIDSAAVAIAAARSDTDRRTIRAQFERDMAADLDRLAKDLRSATWNVLFSRELAVGLLVGLGLLTVPTAQAVGGAVALAGAQRGYRRERLQAFSRHAMSWLHIHHGSAP